MPPTEANLLLWIAYLSQSHSSINNIIKPALKSTTIRLYMTAVGSWSEHHGYINPTHNSPHLKRAIQGYSRIELNPQIRQRYPVTTTLLQKIHTVIDNNNYFDCMIYNAFCMATYGLMRPGEFTHSHNQSNNRILKWQNIAFIQNNNIIQPNSYNSISSIDQYSLYLVESKTDKNRQGATIIISSSIAINAMLMHCQHLTFPINKNNCLFAVKLTNEMEPLTRNQLVKSLRDKLQLLNHPISHLYYNGHSFRRGGASSLMAAGVNEDIIRRMGRWSPNSNTQSLYIQNNSCNNVIHRASQRM